MRPVQAKGSWVGRTLAGEGVVRRSIPQPERTVNQFTNMWARWTRPAIQQLNSPGDAPPLWPNYPMERRLPPQGLGRGDFMSARLAAAATVMRNSCKNA